MARAHIWGLVLVLSTGGIHLSQANPELLDQLKAAKSVLEALVQEQEAGEAALVLSSACPCIEWIIQAVKADAANQLTYAQCVEFWTTSLAGVLSTLCARDEGGDSLLDRSLARAALQGANNSTESSLHETREDDEGLDDGGHTLWMQDQVRRQTALRLAIQLVNQLVEYAQGQRMPWGCVPVAGLLCDHVQVVRRFILPPVPSES